MSVCLSVSPMGEPSGRGALGALFPFFHLPTSVRHVLEDSLKMVSFGPDEVVCRIGAEALTVADWDQGVAALVVVSGGFFRYRADGTMLAGGNLGPGSLVGDTIRLNKSKVEIRSRADMVTQAWVLTEEKIDWLLSCHIARFALGLGTIYRTKYRLFDDFLSFTSFVFEVVKPSRCTSVPLELSELVTRYKSLEPALHSLANDAGRIDFDAWTYSLRRLPKNITSVFTIVCATTLPDAVAEKWHKCLNDDGGAEIKKRKDSVLKTLLGSFVESDERRRMSLEIMPGKMHIFLRDFYTDFLDVLTMLCIHIVESKKLRQNLRPYDAVRVVEILHRGMGAMKECDDVAVVPEIEKQVLLEMATVSNLKPDQVPRLCALWPPGHVLKNLIHIVGHHEDYSVFLNLSDRTNAPVSPVESWVYRLRQAVIDLLGMGELELEDGNLVVDVISSNMHSMKNCLSPQVHTNAQTILDWGKTCVPDLFGESEGASATNLLYAVAKSYFTEHPVESVRADEALRERGFVEVEKDEVLGIKVQLLDVNQYRRRTQVDEIDPELAPFIHQTSTKPRHLIVNLDYAFGRQGEDILRVVLCLFGRSVRSVNVTGKAGGIANVRRGDILLPNYLIDENSRGALRPLPAIDIAASELSDLSGRDVHEGPIITVLGTVLQNVKILRFYERLMHATGMEMEAAWYLNAIKECQTLGVISNDIKLRFIYYVSDTPLDTSATLAKQMRIMEGLPPLYAIMRSILKRCLNTPISESEGSKHKDVLLRRTISCRKLT